MVAAPFAHFQRKRSRSGVAPRCIVNSEARAAVGERQVEGAGGQTAVVPIGEDVRVKTLSAAICTLTWPPLTVCGGA
jgi:hypothetical protein